jgi:pectin methylesterase-like acyl-CoA thioesterase
MKQRSYFILIISLLLLGFGISAIARAQEAAPAGVDAPTDTAFTYQGQLKDASGPVSGNCDFQFGLWDALTDGAQVSTTLEKSNVLVSEGLFTVQLDFGADAFNGSARWLEIAVSCPSGVGVYNTLTPRQPLSPAPYASYALAAGAANTAGSADTAGFADNAGNADTLDGQHATAFQQRVQNLLVVAKSGGDFTTITDALNSITDNSADNPYVIYVAPGIYTETVTMKPYVDIEGAGERATKITYNNTNSWVNGTVDGVDNAELRFLTVESTGGSNQAHAIYNSCGGSARITHVTAIASGGNEYTTGIKNVCGSTPTLTDVTAIASGGGTNNYGVYNLGPVTMINVNASASGGTNNYGVWNEGYWPTMTNVTASASGGTNNYGVYNHAAAPTMTGVIASASGGTTTYGVENDSSGATMTGGSATASGGSVTNYGVYNLSASPKMTNLTVIASGGNDTYGLWSNNSSPIITNVTVTASGGTWNRAVYNESSSSPTMTDLIATASGGNDSYGMWNDSSSVVIQNSIIKATDGIYASDGLHNIATTDSYIIEINNSQISASTSTIYQVDTYYTTKVGASQLAGGGAFGGTYICVASYNGDYAPLNSICQP